MNKLEINNTVKIAQDFEKRELKEEYHYSDKYITKKWISEKSYLERLLKLTEVVDTGNINEVKKVLMVCIDEVEKFG